MSHYRLLLEYDGTDFSGWQYQKGCRTVQDEIEKAIEIFTKERIRVTGAGRTDAGVHASGQVVSLELAGHPEPVRLSHAMNGILPRDVRVLSAAECDPSFNARRRASGKRYRYRILNRSASAAILRGFVFHCPRHLDIPAMKEASGLFKGEHDFSAFRASNCECEHAVRKIFECDVSVEKDNLLTIDVSATAFVKNMVRIMAGTILEVGWGARSIESVSEALRQGERGLAGVTAPPHGLVLEKVFYGEWPSSGIEWPGI